MIRFRRLFDTATEFDRRQFAEVQGIFRKAFDYDPDYADRIGRMMADRAKLGYDLVLLIAEDDKARVLGFSLSFYFSDLRLAYLDYIASDPDRSARGIGDGLYEATRELLVGKGAQGFLFDVPPDDPDKLKEPGRLSVNKRRLKFYERYGARPIVGTLYDQIVTETNEGYLTFLVFDSLGRKSPLHRANLRKFIRRLLEVKYGMKAAHPTVKKILASVRDEPVRLREPRYHQVEETAVRRGRIKPIKVIIVEKHTIHHLREKGYVERPVRVDSVMRGLADVPIETRRPRRHGVAPIRAVHDSHLVSYLETASSRLGPRALLYPTVFPVRRPEKRPRELEMRAGYFCADTFTPLTANAYKAARAAVDCALTGVDALLEGEHFVYALCRPPGHHAERMVWGGFCYFNNAAVAAHQLSAHGRVALIDVDYHHGNGGQDIFYQRSDVLFVSIHGHPNIAYPYFSGFADERGEGDGRGFNRNYPLRPGVDDGRYLEVLDRALADVRRFRPDWFVVSLGFDIMRGDPTGSFLLSVRGIRQIGERIGQLGMPTLIVQEGGYSQWNLRRGARAFFLGLASTWY